MQKETASVSTCQNSSQGEVTKDEVEWEQRWGLVAGRGQMTSLDGEKNGQGQIQERIFMHVSHC